jgi:small subunit ribosomal protein S1
MILDVDREKERISLGLKQRMPNPWDDIERKYPVGTRISGKVVNLVPYGAFVEIEEGVEGMVHVSEISWTKRVAKASDALTVGQEVDASSSTSTRTSRRSRSASARPKCQSVAEGAGKYPIGSRVKGKVRNFTNYGAFVELEEGIDGMIHVSDMSWTRKVNHPSEVLKKGDEVDCRGLGSRSSSSSASASASSRPRRIRGPASPPSTRLARSSRARSRSWPVRRLRGNRGGHRWPGAYQPDQR